MDFLLQVRQGGSVKRYHTVGMNGEQTVATHSWNVAMIIHFLKPNARKELILAALSHDIPEGFLGDTPAPAKWKFPFLAEAIKRAEEGVLASLGLSFNLTEDELLLLKVADILELLYTCIDQRRTGNKNYDIIYHRGRKYFMDMQEQSNIPIPSKASELFSRLQSAFKEACK